MRFSKLLICCILSLPMHTSTAATQPCRPCNQCLAPLISPKKGMSIQATASSFLDWIFDDYSIDLNPQGWRIRGKMKDKGRFVWSHPEFSQCLLTRTWEAPMWRVELLFKKMPDLDLVTRVKANVILFAIDFGTSISFLGTARTDYEIPRLSSTLCLTSSNKLRGCLVSSTQRQQSQTAIHEASRNYIHPSDGQCKYASGGTGG